MGGKELVDGADGAETGGCIAISVRSTGSRATCARPRRERGWHKPDCGSRFRGYMATGWCRKVDAEMH
jgi:hypothetical protein